MAHGFEQIRMAGRHATESVSRTDLGDRALVAVHATVVPHLKEERAISEPVAALDALRAADAQLFVNGVFVIGIVNVGPLNGCGRTEAVLGPSVEVNWLRLKVARAELTIAANGVGVDTLHGGLLEHTMGCAVAAAQTFLGVDLPDRSFG